MSSGFASGLRLGSVKSKTNQLWGNKLTSSLEGGGGAQMDPALKSGKGANNLLLSKV